MQQEYVRKRWFGEANHAKVDTEEEKEEVAVVANLQGIEQPVEGSRLLVASCSHHMLFSIYCTPST